MQNKIYKVVASKRTKDMLVHHAAFIAQVSKVAATRLKDEFVISAKSLREMPQRSPRVSLDDASYSNYRNLIFEGYYILIYQITDDVVYIVCGKGTAGLSVALTLNTTNRHRNFLGACSHLGGEFWITTGLQKT